MSLIFKNNPLQFIHLPKTGGVWVEEALKRAGVAVCRRGHEHGDLDRVLSDQLSFNGWVNPRIGRRLYQIKRKTGNPIQQPRRFCFVRNPFSWYESYWRFMMEHSWFQYGHPNDPERWHPWSEILHIQENDFNRFIERILQERPGYLTNLYMSFVKNGMTYVGKTENLANDLESILQKESIKHDRDIILAQKKRNTTNHDKLKIEWDINLKKQIFHTEITSFLQFNYISDDLLDWCDDTIADNRTQYLSNKLV
ncbi:hypothetical protein N9R65_02895 [Opitutales bacterium]|nr:hypothetical protein [Opitutales bacterium]MDB2681817.1 hypothetical protein [Opitutales bacterium]